MTCPARLREESGLGLLEVLAGLTVLAVGFFALAGALGLGFKQVSLGRQRQTAAEIANARVEHLRNVPYDRVSVRQPPEDPAEPPMQHNTNAENPDYWVQDGSPQLLDVDGDDGAAPLEDLIVTSDGDIDHIEDPVQVGETAMEIYQYTTWVDDGDISGTQDYKRVTVVVKYKVPAINGVTKFVRVSSLFTPETVSTDGAQSSPNPGSSSSPSPSPSPTPTPSGCPGDTIAPSGSFSIVAGAGSEAGFSASTSLTLSLSFSDDNPPIYAQFSNDGTTYGSDVTYDAANPTVSWSVAFGDGSKSVYGKVRDACGNEATLSTQSIVLDTVKPAVATGVDRTLSCTGDDRTVNLTWTASTDANFRGHRIYRSIDNGAWAALGTTGGVSFSDTHKKTHDSVRFKILGYDKAGNESDDGTIVSLSRNQCSG